VTRLSISGEVEKAQDLQLERVKNLTLANIKEEKMRV